MYPPSPLLILITLLANRSPRVPTMCWGRKEKGPSHGVGGMREVIEGWLKQ